MGGRLAHCANDRSMPVRPPTTLSSTLDTVLKLRDHLAVSKLPSGAEATANRSRNALVVDVRRIIADEYQHAVQLQYVVRFDHPGHDSREIGVPRVRQ